MTTLTYKKCGKFEQIVLSGDRKDSQRTPSPRHGDVSQTRLLYHGVFRAFGEQSDGRVVQTDGRRTKLLLSGQGIWFIVRDSEVSIRKERRHATDRQRRVNDQLAFRTYASQFLPQDHACLHQRNYTKPAEL